MVHETIHVTPKSIPTYSFTLISHMLRLLDLFIGLSFAI
jgi:hypothetical protein